MKLRALATAASLVGSAALIAGCGGATVNSPGTKAVHDTASASLARAAYVSSSTSGYRLAMTIHETFGGATVDMAAHSAFSPGQRRGSITQSTHTESARGSNSFKAQLVMTSGLMYIRLPSSLSIRIPGGKPWLSLSFADMANLTGIAGIGSFIQSMSSLSDPGAYLNFLRKVDQRSVKDLGHATVNGVTTTHYRAELDYSKLASALPEAQQTMVTQAAGAPQRKAATPGIPVDVWIDSSHRVRRLKITEKSTVDGRPATAHVTQNFLSYGPQPAPEVPDASQTTDLASLLH